MNPSVGQPNGLDHEPSSTSNADVSVQSVEDIQEMSGTSWIHRENNSSLMDCDDGEDEETVNREVKDVIEYMLDLVEVVVPYAPSERQKERRNGE